MVKLNLPKLVKYKQINKSKCGTYIPPDEVIIFKFLFSGVNYGYETKTNCIFASCSLLGEYRALVKSISVASKFFM